jgi:hypothetical protein
MNKSFLLALAAALVAAPLALAHDPAGTPKNYCEDPSEWNVHDYAPPASGHLIFLGQDGNIGGDCDGDGIPADYDLHIEFAFGGGWLTAATVPECNSEIGHHPMFGPFGAYDTVHGDTITITVAADTINAVPPTDPAAPNCGDFETDEHTVLFPYGIVTFPCGLDGTYVVYVGDATSGSLGTAGHIFS